MADEALMWMRTLNLEESAEAVKTKAALIKLQYNLCKMFSELPAVILEKQKFNEAKQNQQARVAKAAEDSGIHEVGGIQ